MLAFLTVPRLDAQIWEVLKSADIDAQMQNVQDPAILYRSTGFRVSLHSATAGTVLTDDDTGQILSIHREAGVLRIGIERHNVGTGDAVHIERGQPARIESGEIGYLAIRIPPLPVTTAPAFGLPRGPAILRASESAAAAATGENVSARWLWGGAHYLAAYNPCNPDCGPWHAHPDVAQIYLVQSGTAIGELGGQLEGSKPRNGITVEGARGIDSRSYLLGRGDIVIIPQNVPHHVNLNAGKFSYVIVQVWVK